MADYYVDLAFDDEDFAIHEHHRVVKTVVCKYCGIDGLIWQEKNGRWVLVDMEDGRDHKCKLEDLFIRHNERNI